jgi:hypothetical protein
MDLLDKLVGGAGCGPDGAAAARNPLGKLVDQFLDSAQVCPTFFLSNSISAIIQSPGMLK